MRLHSSPWTRSTVHRFACDKNKLLHLGGDAVGA
jgi:hypothetical protein